MATVLATTLLVTWASNEASAKVLTYRIDSRWGPEIRSAIKARNQAGVNVRFVRARAHRRPYLRFIDDRFPDLTTLGQMDGRIIRMRRGGRREYGALLLRTMGQTAAHELGRTSRLRALRYETVGTAASRRRPAGNQIQPPLLIR